MAESRAVVEKKKLSDEDKRRYLTEKKVTDTREEILKIKKEGKFQQATAISRMEPKVSIPVIIRLLLQIETNLRAVKQPSANIDETIKIVNEAVTIFSETDRTLNMGTVEKGKYLYALNPDTTIAELQQLVDDVKQVEMTADTTELWDEVALWMEGIYRRTADKIKKGQKPCDVLFAAEPVTNENYLTVAAALGNNRAHAAYIRHGDSLCYVDQENKLFTEIPVTREKLVQFDVAEVRALTDKDLKTIKAMTGHEAGKQCQLLVLAQPSGQDNPEDFRLIVKAGEAYVRSRDNLYYVNKKTNEVVKLNFGKDSVAKLDKDLKITIGARKLAEKDIKQIAAIVGHTHPLTVMPLRDDEGHFPRVDILEDGVLFKATKYKLTKMEVSLYYHQAASALLECIQAFKNKKVAAPVQPVAAPVKVAAPVPVKVSVPVPAPVVVPAPAPVPVVKKVSEPVIVPVAIEAPVPVPAPVVVAEPVKVVESVVVAEPVVVDEPVVPAPVTVAEQVSEPVIVPVVAEPVKVAEPVFVPVPAAEVLKKVSEPVMVPPVVVPARVPTPIPEPVLRVVKTPSAPIVPAVLEMEVAPVAAVNEYIENNVSVTEDDNSLVYNVEVGKEHEEFLQGICNVVNDMLSNPLVDELKKDIYSSDRARLSNFRAALAIHHLSPSQKAALANFREDAIAAITHYTNERKSYLNFFWKAHSKDALNTIANLKATEDTEDHLNEVLRLHLEMFGQSSETLYKDVNDVLLMALERLCPKNLDHHLTGKASIQEGSDGSVKLRIEVAKGHEEFLQQIVDMVSDMLANPLLALLKKDAASHDERLRLSGFQAALTLFDLNPNQRLMLSNFRDDAVSALNNYINTKDTWRSMFVSKAHAERARDAIKNLNASEDPKDHLMEMFTLHREMYGQISVGLYKNVNELMLRTLERLCPRPREEVLAVAAKPVAKEPVVSSLSYIARK